MSQDYDVVPPTPDFVTVSSSPEREVSRLAELFGRVPVTEVLQVLDSEWAVERGWTAVSTGSHYQIALENGVAQNVVVHADGNVTLERSVPQVTVAYAAAGETQAQHSALLAAAAGPGNLAFYQVVARGIRYALPNRARQLGWEVTEEILDTHTQTEDLVLLHCEKQF
jgi:hypothetical protein